MVQATSLIALGLFCLSVSASPIATQKDSQAAVTPKAPATGSKAPTAAAPKTPVGKGDSKTGNGEGKHSGTVKITPKASTKKAKAAHPNHMKGLPSGTHMLAFDQEKGQLHAFDKGMKHIGSVNAVGKGGKADAKSTTKGSSNASGTSKAPPPPSKMLRQKRNDVSACTPLSSDDVQKLPGWNAIKSAAEAAWGTGSYNVVTNDKDYPDYPATSCVDQSPSMLVINGQPQCSSASSTLSGQLANDGTVAVTHQFGTSYETSMTVTKESSMSIGATVSAEFGIEDVAKIGVSTTWEASMTNSLAKGTTASSNTMESHTITMNSSGGQSCSLDVTTKSCQIQGSGKVRVTASGWVWFEYNDRTNGHYKWAMSIDNAVKNIDDRSSFMEYKAQVSSKTATNYKSNCKVTSDNKSK